MNEPHPLLEGRLIMPVQVGQANLELSQTVFAEVLGFAKQK